MHSDRDGHDAALRLAEPCKSGRNAKFHDPITIEPADCRQAAKTGHLKLRGKEHPFEMNVRKGVSVELVGGLDDYGNCRVGMFHLDGVTLESQMATAT